MKDVFEDVQGRPDARAVALDAAGVRGLTHPFKLDTGAAGVQPVLARLAMSCALPGNVKGTHMSRFVEAAGALETPLSAAAMVLLARDVRKRLDAEKVSVEAEFRFVLAREAPVTGARGFVDYRGALSCALDGGDVITTTRVEVPVTSLCPCSKAISDYGAHNQRGVITIQATHDGAVTIEELVELAEASGSSPVYSILKRPDERLVTMRAYETPMFVEDMVRAVAVRLRDDSRVRRARISAVNDESIHNHQAFAELSF
jgi:GTP cyclohydrolase FolE2